MKGLRIFSLVAVALSVAAITLAGSPATGAAAVFRAAPPHDRSLPAPSTGTPSSTRTGNCTWGRRGA